MPTNNEEILNLMSPLMDEFTTSSQEWNLLFDLGLREYLKLQVEKYYSTSTFFHIKEKVRFDDYYYPIKARNKDFISDFNDLNKVLESYKNIIILGSGGSGKTTLLNYILLQSIREKIKIPIVFELRNININPNDEGFETLIFKNIILPGDGLNESILIRALKSGKFLFLFDGYDEIFLTKKNEITRQIELFIDCYSSNSFLITARPGSGIEGFPRFNEFTVCDLTDRDVSKFITKMVDSEERRKRILNTIQQPKNKVYIEYLRNPLLLSMFISSYENHPEIPSKKSSFYRNVFDTLYSRHDARTKNSFTREKLTKLDREDFENILKIFSYISMVQGYSSFTDNYLTDTLKIVKEKSIHDFVIEYIIHDFSISMSILIKDGFHFSFPHRSLQEYFTALFVQGLPFEKKQSVYGVFSSKFEIFSEDNSLNFWQTCYEVDKNAFVSIVLLGFVAWLQ